MPPKERPAGPDSAGARRGSALNEGSLLGGKREVIVFSEMKSAESRGWRACCPEAGF